MGEVVPGGGRGVSIVGRGGEVFLGAGTCLVRGQPSGAGGRPDPSAVIQTRGEPAAGGAGTFLGRALKESVVKSQPSWFWCFITAQSSQGPVIVDGVVNNENYAMLL